MKRIKYLAFLLIVMIITTTSVSAATITSTSYNGNIKVEGTGSGQIQIVLFDLENNPIYMTTTSSTDNKFSMTLPKIDGLKAGTYKVKVADYDGTNVSTESVIVTADESQESVTNPQTFDGIAVSFIISILSFLGIIVGCIIFNRKKNELL